MSFIRPSKKAMGGALAFACLAFCLTPRLYATVLPANGAQEDSPRLGDGYDSIFKVKKWGCVVGTAREGQDQSISSELEFASNMSLDSLVNSLEVGPHLSLNKYFFNLRTNFQMMNAHSASETSSTFHFFWRGTGKTISFDHSAGYKPNDINVDNFMHLEGEEVDQAHNLVDLRSACGDEFVSEIRYGAYLIVTLKINFATKEDKNKFDAEIQLGTNNALSASKGKQAGGSKTEKLDTAEAEDLSFSIKEKLVDLDKSHKLRSSSVEVIVNQVGGDPTDMRTILGSRAISGELITECTGTNDLPKCVNGFSEAVEYAKRFLESLASKKENLWSPMVYLTTSYGSVLGLKQSELGLMDESVVVSEELEKEIEQLDIFLDQARTIELKATNLLDSLNNNFYHVDNEVIAAIKDIQSKARQVHIDVKSEIYAQCTKKSSRCADKVSAFKEKYPYPYKLDIDERYLDLRAQDGGIKELDYLAGSAEGGRAFNHTNLINDPSNRSVVEVTLHGGERPNFLKIKLDDDTELTVGRQSSEDTEYYFNPFDPASLPVPIGKEDESATHSLQIHANEAISYIEAHEGKVDRNGRVVYLKICKSDSVLNAQQSCVEAGTPSDDYRMKDQYTINKSEKLIGFHGHEGKEIDLIGIIVARKSQLIPAP